MHRWIFLSIFERTRKKYERKTIICNTIRFNIGDQNIQKKSRKPSLLLKQEELLTEEAKKYPCLYNKADKSYNEHGIIRNA